MKKYISLAGFAFAVLAFASVWMGSLNQDEGWYLYAAQLVGEGKTLYKDFAYTQGPLMPRLYASVAWVWNDFGLLGARVLTCILGLLGILVAAGTAWLVARKEDGPCAAVATFLLLGSNIYHVYYTTIPKTYALAMLFVSWGFCFLSAALLSSSSPRVRRMLLAASGLSLAFAAGTRISLGALLAVFGFTLLFSFRRYRWSFLWFGLGGAFGLAYVYGPYIVDGAAFAGLCAAQKYHAARGGFDPVFTVGSLSRLVRWYLPVFILLGLGAFSVGKRSNSRETQTPNNQDARQPKQPANPNTQTPSYGCDAGRFLVILALLGFAAVFFVQMLAPFPYEDYQVPVMGLLAVAAAVMASRIEWLPRSALPLLALGLAWATSFGSPLLEKWTTNGQDRFWSIKKEKSELAQLRDMARVVEAVDPGGKTLLTQDLYLAIETGRKVPKGLEMGPFSILSDDEWHELLTTCECPVAALSGYTFAVEPPRCTERPFAQQIKYWDLLKKRYDLVMKEEAFGQNATTLLILKRKEAK